MVGLRIPGRPTGPTESSYPDTTPLTRVTLTGKRFGTNSRFLTNCYHDPAAVWAVRWRNIGSGCKTAASAAAPPGCPRLTGARQLCPVAMRQKPGDSVISSQLSPTPGSSLGVGAQATSCRSGTAQYRVSVPAGAGRPGSRVDPAHPCYAQAAPAGRAGQGLAAPAAWRIRTRARVAVRPDAASSDDPGGAPFVAQVAPSAAPARVPLPPWPAHAGQVLRRRAAPAAICAAPDAPPGAAHRARRESHSAPAPAALRAAACGARALLAAPPAAE